MSTSEQSMNRRLRRIDINTNDEEDEIKTPTQPTPLTSRDTTSTLKFSLTATPLTSEDKAIFNVLPKLLHPLFLAHLLRLKENPEILHALSYHLIPEVIPSRDAGEESRQAANAVVTHFLREKNSNNISPLFLLLGDSGFGKSVYLTQLERSFWRACLKPNHGKKLTVFLFFELKWLKDVSLNSDIVATYLGSLQRDGQSVYSRQDIEQLRQQYEWVILADGWDEATGVWKDQPFYQLGHIQHWSKQMIVSCRHEYFKEEMVSILKIGSSLPRWWIAPFRSQQVNAYLDAHLANGRGAEGWKKTDYEQALQAISQLNELLVSPLLCRMVLDILPKVSQHDLPELKRVQIYSLFIDGWFEREQERLHVQGVKLPKERFTPFCRGLGITMFLEGFANEVVYVPGRVSLKTQIAWDDFFGEANPDFVQLRQASPLRRVGDRYGFFHKSFMEFFAASFLWEESLQAHDLSIQTTQRLVKELLQAPQNAIWNQRFLTQSDALAVLAFLAEFLQTTPPEKRSPLEERLKAFALVSRHRPDLSIVASNALSVLNRANICFSNWDLSNTYLPYVDLSYSLCDHTNFRNCNLDHGNFIQAWIRGADFTESQMTNTVWGQKPWLEYEEEVKAMTYSQDGQSLVVVSGTGMYCYCTKTMELEQTIEGNIEERVALSSSGRWIALGGSNGIWLAERTIIDKEIKLKGITVEGKMDVTAVAISSDGEWIVSIGWDKSFEQWENDVRLWEWKTYPLPRFERKAILRLWERKTGIFTDLKGHLTKRDNVVAISLDGAWIVSGGDNHSVYLWERQTGALTVFSGHSERVTAVTVSSDGEWIASGDKSGTVHLWTRKTGCFIRFEAHFNSSIKTLAISLDGEWVVSGGGDHAVCLWKRRTNALTVLKGHAGKVTAVAISPDGEWIASGGKDKTVRLWERKILWDRKIGFSNICAISSADGAWILLVNDYIAGLQERITGRMMVMKEFPYNLSAITISPDGAWVVVGNDDGEVYVWERKIGKMVVLKGHTKRVRRIAISSDGAWIASGGEDKTVRLWERKTGSSVTLTGRHKSWLDAIAISSNGAWIASASDNNICLWERKTNNVTMLKGHVYGVSAIAISSNGAWIVSAENDGEVRVWERKTGSMTILKDHTDQEDQKVTAVAISPDEAWIALGVKTVQLWERKTGRCFAILGGYQHKIIKIDFNPTSSYRLVTCSAELSVKCWQYFPATIQDEARWSLVWSSNHPIVLHADGACLHQARGLDNLTKRLLERLGATSTPIAKPPLSFTNTVPFQSLSIVQPKNPVLSATFSPFSKSILSQRQSKLRSASKSVDLAELAVEKDVFWSAFIDVTSEKERFVLLEKYLSSSGDPNTVASEGWLLLHWLVRKNDKKCLELLLKHNQLNTHVTTPEGQTALHIAVQFEAYALIELLLKAGVLAHQRNAHNQTPYEWARQHRPNAQHPGLQLLQAAEQEARAYTHMYQSWQKKVDFRLYRLAQGDQSIDINLALTKLRQKIETSALKVTDKSTLLARLQSFHFSTYTSLPLPTQKEQFDYKVGQLSMGSNEEMVAVLILRKTINHLGLLSTIQREALFVVYSCFQGDPSSYAQLDWCGEAKQAAQMKQQKITKSKTHEEKQLARKKWIVSLTDAKKPALLKSSDALLYRLEQRRIACEKALQSFVDPNAVPPLLKELPNALRQLYQADITFIAALCQGTVMQREKLLQPRMTCLLFNQQPFYVVYEVTQQLRARAHVNENSQRQRAVVSYKGTHIKRDPDAPGYENAVFLLNQALHLLLTSINEWGKLYDDGDSWTVLVSKTVRGELLKKVLSQGGKVFFDKTAFVDSAFFHLLIRPYDGKSDNYIAETVRVEQKIPLSPPFSKGEVTVYRPIGIDNDLSFTDSVIQQKNGEHLCNIHYALFFHPQMDEPIPEGVRHRWRDPKWIVVLVGWIHQVERDELKQFEQLIDAGLFTLEELKKLRLPTCFPRNAMAQTLRDLMAIQVALNDPAVMTLNDVLKRVNPAVYVFYKGYLKWAKQRQLSYADPRRAIEGLQKNREQGGHKDTKTSPAYLVDAPFTFEVIIREVQDVELQSMAKTVISNVKQHAIAITTAQSCNNNSEQKQALPQLTDFLFDEKRRYPNLGYSQAEMWEVLDLSQFSQELQSELFDIAMTTIGYPSLMLNNSNVITDKKLLKIIKQHPNLMTLTLHNCEKITVMGLLDILKERRLLLILNSNDLREGWEKFANQTDRLCIQLKKGELWTVGINGKLQRVPDALVSAVQNDPNASQFAKVKGLLSTSPIASQITQGFQQRLPVFNQSAMSRSQINMNCNN